MKLFSTQAHGILDYSVGTLLMFSPWLFGFANGGAESWTAVLVGAITIFYSLMTEYEAGLFEILSMRTHLVIDKIFGVVLVISPWLFGFANQVWLPHVVAGVLYVFVAFATRSRTGWTRLRRVLKHHSPRFPARAAG